MNVKNIMLKGKPQPLCDLQAHENMRCLFVNQRHILSIHLSFKVQKTWPWLKAKIGHKTTI
jgi:hypothetical protein